MIHGIINVYKEKGFTSHDVVAKMRGILHQKKIGHTGTLDPEAEGVLPVCLGAGTKLCDMLADRDKEYRAVLLLGRTTDTQDITGRVLASSEEIPPEETVRQAVLEFVGDYDQIPPMYSALKVNGKKLYELAREGKTVERKARKVRIERIMIEEMDLPRVTLLVTCSKGTYIRTLCHDIGERLSCGGCMESLLRTRVGKFELEQARRLDEIREMTEKGDLEKAVIPVDRMFDEMAAGYTTQQADHLLYNGNPLAVFQLEKKCNDSEEKSMFSEMKNDGLPMKIRVYDSKGTFCGVYEYRAEKEKYLPVKMFLEGQNR